MEYMESKMQSHIESGISEADRCYTRIAELEEQNTALAAQVHVLTTAAKYILNSKKRQAKQKAYAALADAVNKTAQQHRRELDAEEWQAGFITGAKMGLESPQIYAMGLEAVAKQSADRNQREGN